MTGFMNEREVARIRKVYPVGTKIVLISMDDPYSKLNPGDKGSVVHVDDAGQIHVKWECGSSLALIPGEDSFSKI